MNEKLFDRKILILPISQMSTLAESKKIHYSRNSQL